VSAAESVRLCGGRRTWLGLVLQACAALAWAQDDLGPDELHVKAAFLYKFTSYVDWPEGAFAGADGPFLVGVQGADALYGELGQLVASRKVHERAVLVRRLVPGESTAGLHMLFAGRGSALRAEPGRPVLVVTEAEGEMPLGSMINFRLVERRVRFDIALDAVETAGLRMSSRLLAVARRVYRAGGS